ncbi:MAG TPA: phosphate/phosphite/phosphonate ABC transporter substrate-binding protein [Nitrospirota bacterium]
MMVSFTERMVRVLLSLILCAGICGAVDAAAAGKHVYTVAIVPQFPPADIERDWGPFIERLSHDTALKLQIRFYKSIPEFEQDILDGVPDFVYLNPYHEVMAKKAQGYIPLIRDGEDRLVGILVVDKDSGIRSVKDLNGKIIVFPSPNAFAASLYMRALLSKREHVHFTPKYVITHSNVYQHVVSGMAAAGGGANTTLNKEPRELRRELRVIYETPSTAPHPFAAHPRVPRSIRKKLRSAAMKLAADNRSRLLLKAVGMPKPVIADYERDYRPLEPLDLGRYAVQGGD